MRLVRMVVTVGLSLVVSGSLRAPAQTADAANPEALKKPV